MNDVGSTIVCPKCEEINRVIQSCLSSLTPYLVCVEAVCKCQSCGKLVVMPRTFNSRIQIPPSFKAPSKVINLGKNK